MVVGSAILLSLVADLIWQTREDIISHRVRESVNHSDYYFSHFFYLAGVNLCIASNSKNYPIYRKEEKN